jgi:hypothetical protein
MATTTGNVAADSARDVAVALAARYNLAGRSGWRPGRPVDLGSTATLELRRGSRRDPGDPPDVVDTEQVVTLHFRKGAQE